MSQLYLGTPFTSIFVFQSQQVSMSDRELHRMLSYIKCTHAVVDTLTAIHARTQHNCFICLFAYREPFNINLTA